MDKKITFDDLIEKIPNKYILTIVVGKRIRELGGHTVINSKAGQKETTIAKCFKDIYDGKVVEGFAEEIKELYHDRSIDRVKKVAEVVVEKVKQVKNKIEDDYGDEIEEVKKVAKKAKKKLEAVSEIIEEFLEDNSEEDLEENKSTKKVVKKKSTSKK
ncbi:MAG: DNA-directed RNA polymerase subunit omega [Fusobacteriaceae bacterium]